ncbi:unnamed protein product, partial [Closterium sp. NIES-53]
LLPTDLTRALVLVVPRLHERADSRVPPLASPLASILGSSASRIHPLHPPLPLFRSSSIPPRASRSARAWQKVRSKVGRKLPPPSNETKTTVKAKTIVLPGQKLLDDRLLRRAPQKSFLPSPHTPLPLPISPLPPAIVLPGQKLLDDRSQAAVSQRGHTLPELLAQSGHYSDKVRQGRLGRMRLVRARSMGGHGRGVHLLVHATTQSSLLPLHSHLPSPLLSSPPLSSPRSFGQSESLVRLRELLAANPDELRRHAGTILAKLAPRIADVDKKTRDSLLLLMRSVLFPTMQPELILTTECAQCMVRTSSVLLPALPPPPHPPLTPLSQERMAPFFTLLMGHVGCAMTHVAPDIRHAALPFLSALLAHYPSLFRSSSTAQVLLALPSPPLAPPPCHAPRGSLSSSPTRLAPSLLGHSRDPHHTPARSPQPESLIWNRCLTAICHYLFRRSLTFSVTPVFPFTFFPASTPSLPSTRPHLSPPLPPHAHACSTIISPPPCAPPLY